MLTKLTIRNFKRFGEVEIELGNPVVFIGPNNSGKTSAMQALALWDVGLRRWNEKRSGKTTPEKRPGVTINRRDLIAVPVPGANLLWRDLHVREGRRDRDRLQTLNVRIDIVVEGVTEDRSWTCGLEFDFANEESFYCRPLRRTTGKNPERMPVPEEAGTVQIAFLPPMSGLAATETRLDQGAINVRIGEGRTAEVLRNLCYQVETDKPELWQEIVTHIHDLFGSKLASPKHIAARGEIVMTYQENDVQLDLSSSGRGLQQTLLLLAYMYANPGSVLLLDEPDAHLEILRQRQIYGLLIDVAGTTGSQIIAASHSEVLLTEAAGKHMVVAFVGQPHRIDDRGSQVLKALREIGYEQYTQAEQTGWVLYLEGPTDLSILQAFADRLKHEAAIRALKRPFVYYVGNNPTRAQHHFHGLREAIPDLRGVVLFDRFQPSAPDVAPVECLMWNRREIDNYLCSQSALEIYARASTPGKVGPLFTMAEADRRLKAMNEAIREIEGALKKLGRESPWSPELKTSDEFLRPLFDAYFQKLELPNLMAKRDYYELADHVPDNEIDPEISEKLDVIAQVAQSAEAAQVN
ncbi:MAG: AAA family ATPase [Acidobacteriota bacterium]|nr:AAA family ATPase [Acidobacteriota bacterium]